MNESLYPGDEYPHGHLNLQRAYSAWASILVREGRLEEAEVFANRAGEMLKERCSPNCLFGGNDDLAASWIDLGRIKRAQGGVRSGRGAV